MLLLSILAFKPEELSSIFTRHVKLPHFIFVWEYLYLSFLEYGSAECDLFFFLFWALWIYPPTPSWHLACRVSAEKYTDGFMEVSLSLFSLIVFKILSVFDISECVMSLRVIFAGSVLFGIFWSSRMLMPASLLQFRKFSGVIFSNKLSSPFSVSSFLGFYNARWSLYIPYASSLFFIPFSFCSSNWLISNRLSSC